MSEIKKVMSFTPKRVFDVKLSEDEIFLILDMYRVCQSVNLDCGDKWMLYKKMDGIVNPGRS